MATNPTAIDTLTNEPTLNVGVTPPTSGTDSGVSQKELDAEYARSPGVNYDAAVGNILNTRDILAKTTGGSPGIISSDQAKSEDEALGETIDGMDNSLTEPDMIPGPNGTMVPNPNSQSGIWGGAIYDAQGNLRNPSGEGASTTGTGDPMTDLLTRMMDENNKRFKEEEAELQRQRDQATIGAKRAGDNSMGVSQLALLRSGGFSAMSGQAYLTSLAADNKMKLHQIDMDYLNALRKARDARTDMDFKLAGQMIERAEQLKKDFIAERAAQDAHLLSVQNIMNMKAENLEKKLELMAKSGLTSAEVDPKLLAAFDQEGGYAPGTTAHLLDFLADQAKQTKEEKSLDLKNKAIDNQLKIADLISKMPAGRSFFVDGKEYFGTASVRKNVSTQVEIDENGNGTLVWVNEDVTPGQPGFSGSVNLGHIGAAKDNWINAYDASTGTTYRYNTVTQEANPILTKGGFANPANDPNFTAWQSELGDISQPFGVASKEQPNGHTGVDIAIADGTPINPFFPEGVETLTVVAVKSDAKNGDPGYGNYVDLKDDQGNVWRYAHLRESEGGLQTVNVEIGQTFTRDTEKDTPIGWSGHTGSVHSVHGGNGAHLHIEKRAQVNPLSLTTAAGQDKVNFPTGSGSTPLVTEYAGAVNKIDSNAILQAKTLATEVFGKVNGAKNENVNPILEKYAMGATFDDIKDDMRHQSQSGDLGPDGKYYQYGTAIDNALKGKSPTIVGASKDQLDDQLSKGDLDGAKDTVIRAAKAGALAAAQNSVLGQETTIIAINEMEYLIQYMEANGVDTGILQGTANEILNKVGKVGNAYLTQLTAAALTNLQSYRASTTGKQFSQQETEEYKKLFPSATGEYDLNMARLNVLRDSLKRSLRTFYIDRIGEGAYYGIGLEDRIFIGESSQAPSNTPESDAMWDQFVKDHPELANVQ